MKYIEKTEIEKKREEFILKENTLIQKAVYMFSVQQQRILEYMLSHVRPNDQRGNEYSFRALDFLHVAGMSDRSGYYSYQMLENDIVKIYETSWWEYGVKANGRMVKRRVRWLDKFEVSEDGIITFKFSEDTEKYLLGVRSKFTTYQLENVLSFKSRYTIRLYELMKSYERLREKGSREAIVIIPLDKLKILLEVTIPQSTYQDGAEAIEQNGNGMQIVEKELYPRYFDFRKNVLEKSVEEICDIANDINVSFREIRTRKTVREIEFTIWSKIPRTQEDRETTERRNKRIRKHDSQHNGILNE